MAKKPDIQYITQFYVPGSEAQVIEFKPAQKKRRAKTVLPKAEPQKKIPLPYDPAAVFGIALAVVMAILLTVNIFQLLDICKEEKLMSDRIITLQNEYVQLRDEYQSGYDLEEIKIMAEAMGLVPAEELKTVAIQVEVPVAQAEPTWWENLCWFVKGLFA